MDGKEIYYSIKTFKKEIFTTCLSLIGIYVTSFLQLEETMKWFVSSAILFISLFLIMYFRIKEKDFYFLRMGSKSDLYEWIGGGVFEYSRSNDCYLITQSASGYIYSKCLHWSNYRLTFDFKIVNKCLGVLVRAINLSNCIMLQINSSVNAIRPHIRINAGWNVWEQSKLPFERNMDLNKWHNCTITCEKNLINIKICQADKNEAILDRAWQMPQGIISVTYKGSEATDTSVSIPYSIDLDYGSFGFRSDGREEALIKNVLIERI